MAGEPDSQGIFATSDVARDILQNSAFFTSAGKAIGEYVWNSIDYGKPSQRVEVHVRFGRGRIQVRQHKAVRFRGVLVEETTNGGGMSREDLRRFFTMHAETLARREGRRVRGRFGTGKSAAFGIGKTLIVDTVKDGRRNVVRLSLEDLKPGQTRIPVEHLLTDQPTSESDGTKVIIDRLKLRRIKVESAKKFLSRSIGRLLTSHDIYVDGEKLEYSMPGYEREWLCPCPAEFANLVGPCELVLHLAKSELDTDDRGIVILANGYPLEILELEKFRFSPWASRMFGEVDAPALDTAQDEIPIFDNTRSRLNRDNDRVQALLGWLDEEIEKTTTELDAQARAKIDWEKLEKLKRTASELEELLNDDFSKILDELESTPPISGKDGLLGGIEGEGADRVLKTDPEGDSRVTLKDDGAVTVIVSEGEGQGPVEPQPSIPKRGDVTPEGLPATEIETGAKKRIRRGGFRITYKNMGPDAPRAEFIRSQMEIQVNLDFPEIAMFESDVEDFRFKALSAELAISEYAVAAVQYKVEYRHLDVEDTAASALIEYRRTINRLGRALEPLLQRWISNPTTAPS